MTLLTEIPDALRFVDEAYKHGKAIAASAEGVDLVKESQTGELVANDDATAQGVLYASDVKSLAPDFIEVSKASRFTSSIARIPLYLSWPEGKARRLTYLTSSLRSVGSSLPAKFSFPEAG